jgi:hypothetical protein
MNRRFSRASLLDQGFQGFQTFRELQHADFQTVPKSGGIYIVLRETNTLPRYLGESPVLKHKGSSMGYARETLEKRWVSQCHLIYVGRAKGTKGNTLSDRLKKYSSYGAGNAKAAHRGGRAIWQIEGASDFIVAWKIATDAEKPCEMEARLAQEFMGVHGCLPFANMQKPPGMSKL